MEWEADRTTADFSRRGAEAQRFRLGLGSNAWKSFQNNFQGLENVRASLKTGDLCFTPLCFLCCLCVKSAVVRDLISRIFCTDAERRHPQITQMDADFSCIESAHGLSSEIPDGTLHFRLSALFEQNHPHKRLFCPSSDAPSSLLSFSAFAFGEAWSTLFHRNAIERKNLTLEVY
jgi:hypothetical protein